jgi:hypothetical protein
MALFGPDERFTCINCEDPFTDKNVFTHLGWKETRISGMCERCFDAWSWAFEDEEESFGLEE